MVPGFGFVSEIIPVFSRKVIFATRRWSRPPWSIGAVAMSTWAQHMFTVGMGGHAEFVLRGFDHARRRPTGVKIFNLARHRCTAASYGSGHRYSSAAPSVPVPLRRADRSMLSVAPFDWQLSDSYFCRRTLPLRAVRRIALHDFAALYYCPEGDRPDAERAARALALLAARRRLQPDLRHDALPGTARHAAADLHVPRDRGWDVLNLVTTLGVPLQALAVLIFIVNVVYSLRRGAPAGDNPVGGLDARMGHDLSAARDNFAALPPITSRRPLWDVQHSDDPDGPHE